MLVPRGGGGVYERGTPAVVAAVCPQPAHLPYPHSTCPRSWLLLNTQNVLRAELVLCLTPRSHLHVRARPYSWRRSIYLMQTLVLEGWILKILSCDPKGSRAFFCGFSSRRGEVFDSVGRNHNTQDLQEPTNIHSPRCVDLGMQPRVG